MAALLLHGRENAAQDVDLVLIELGAVQEAADAVHEAGAAGRAVAEVHLVHDLLQMYEQPLHLDGRRQRRRHRRRFVLRTARTPGLVGDELHGHREVQRGVLGVRRDPQQQVRERELVVGQPRALVAEQQRDRSAVRMRDDPGRALAHIAHAEVLIAVARSGRGDQAAVADRLLQTVDDACPAQQVVGAGGARGRFRVGKLLRAHQHQLLEAHVLHRTRDGADVAGVGGLDEDHADVGRRDRVHLACYSSGVPPRRSFPACSHS